MCGIFFICSKNKISEVEEGFVDQALNMLRHRGPDAHGIYKSNDGHTILGHTRLEIVGLGDQGKQPFLNNEKALIYNGEIYNIQTLKQTDLLKNIKFETSTDTEVLHKLLDYGGIECLSEIDGMFAFAFCEDGKLLVATDAFAEKPVFIFQCRDFVAGCSELKVLVNIFNLEKLPREQTELEFLSFGFSMDGATFYKNVSQLRPSECVNISFGKVVRRTSFQPTVKSNKCAPNKLKFSIQDSTKVVRDLLIESIETRLIADVPVCLFLSAGIDSTLLAAIASKELGVKLECVTVSFDQNNNSIDEEALSAQKIAHAFGHDHCIVSETSEGNYDVIENMLDFFSQPQDNPTSVALSTMTKSVKGKYKVAVTGLGADELFFGYGKHKYFFDRDQQSNKMLKIVRSIYSSYFLNLLGKESRIERKYLLSNFENYLSVKNPHFYKYLILHPDYPRLSGFFGSFDHGSLDAYADFEISQILPFSKNLAVDVASMRNSVELRSPYLNYRLYKTISALDVKDLCGPGQKHFLRKLLKPYLPEDIKWVGSRMKTGFSHPIKVEKGQRESSKKSNMVWQRRNATLEHFYR